MPFSMFDLNPVDRFTADAIGQPGERTFYLQGRKGRRTVTLVCEKQQLAALCLAIEEFLLSLADNDPDKVAEPDSTLEGAMDLEFPFEPDFRVGQMSLNFDKKSGRIVVVAYELQETESAEQASMARFWTSPAQARAFVLHAEEVLAAGRPVCAMCGEPMEPDGHFCLRKNGDKH